MTIKSILATVMLLLSFHLSSQHMAKPYKTIVVERQINASADRVWKALVLDYGKIADFSPFVYTSDYLEGSLKGELGARRKCAFNASGTRWSHEEIKAIDHENMEMKNVLIDAEKFPLDLDNTYALYYVRDNGDGTSTAGYEFNFRTKPAFMASLAKGAFRKSLNETLIGLDHHLMTGERVTGGSENAKQVLKAYKADGRYKEFATVKTGR